MVIRCVAGDLSIEAPMVRSGTMLIRMPEHCLIPVKAFKLALVNEQTRPRPVLVPVTDFLNHHWTGAPYSYDRYRAVVMRRSAPLPGKGDECFASYGLHDAYDTWISYGFVDEDVPFAQSLSTTVV